MVRLDAPNTGKATIYSPYGNRMSTEGRSSDVVYYSFMCLSETDRKELLAKMAEWHEQNSSENKQPPSTR